MGLGGKPIEIGDIGLLQVIDYGMYMQGYIKQTVKMTALWLKGRLVLLCIRERKYSEASGIVERREKKNQNGHAPGWGSRKTMCVLWLMPWSLVWRRK